MKFENQKILVTGANGHLGLNICLELNRLEIPFRATVKNLREENRIKPLEKLTNEIVEADLNDEKIWLEVSKGITAIINCASPTKIWARDADMEIFNPMLKGAENIVASAKINGIKQILHISTCATIGLKTTLDRPLTEKDKNVSLFSPYFQAKLLTEEKMRELSKKASIKFISFHPALILGPNFTQLSQSLKAFASLLKNNKFPLPAASFHIVDVRDVAFSVVSALIKDISEEKFILAGEFLSVQGLLKKIKSIMPNLEFSERILSDKFYYPLAFCDCLISWLTFRPRLLSLDQIKDYKGLYQYVDNSRSVEKLGVSYMPFGKTLEDTINDLDKFHKAYTL